MKQPRANFRNTSDVDALALSGQPQRKKHKGGLAYVADPAFKVGSSASLVTADCLVWLKAQPSKSIPIFFFSPPYNKRAQRKRPTRENGFWNGAQLLVEGYASYSDDMPHDEYVVWMKAILSECWRVLKDDGAIFFQHKDQQFKGRVLTPEALIPPHVLAHLRQRIIWDRKVAYTPNQNFLNPSYEFVHLLAKPTFKFGSCGKITDVLNVRPTAKIDPDHPAPFPVELPQKIFEQLKPEHDVICDIFSGSGSTGVAARATGRNYIGVEMDAGYNATASKRLDCAAPTVLEGKPRPTVAVDPFAEYEANLATRRAAISAAREAHREAKKAVKTEAPVETVTPVDVPKADRKPRKAKPAKVVAASVPLTARLWLGDSLKRMKSIPDASVDLIAADLPYQITKAHWDRLLPMEELWAEYRRILKPTGNIVLTAAGMFTAQLMTAAPDLYKYSVIWEKTRATNFFHCASRALTKHEDVLIFSKGGIGNHASTPTTYNPQGLVELAEPFTSRNSNTGGGLWKARGLKADTGRYQTHTNWPTSVVRFASVGKVKGDAPETQKPVALMDWIIRTYSNPGDVVLDNCLGSGTTGVAALAAGRSFIGIEKEANFYETAVSRIRASAPEATFLDDAVECEVPTAEVVSITRSCRTKRQKPDIIIGEFADYLMAA